MKNLPKGSAATIQGLTLTGVQLGKLLGLSERRVRELRDDGVIPDNGAGQYVLGAAVPAYCAHMRPASGKEAAGGSEGGLTLDAVRVRLITAQADAREMLNAQTRGEAVLSEDLDVVVGAICDAVRQRMLALPSSAASRIAGLTDPIAILEILTELVTDALAELAAAEVVQTVKDKARRRAGRSAEEVDEEAGEP